MTSPPELSIVVASCNARRSAVACVESLLAQVSPGGRRSHGDVEILIVDNSTDGTYEVLKDRFPSVRVIRQAPDRFIPELWAAGIQETEGAVVAITTAHCVPNNDWVSVVLEAHEGPWAAVGGAIRNDPAAGPIDWAVYFCRYSRYMLPLRAGEVQEIAGDNASYKRSALLRCRESWENGFWEPAVHAAIRSIGDSLFLDPGMVVTHCRSFDACGFTLNRLLHGRQFGSERATRLSVLKRFAYILSTPAVCPLLLARSARQCLARRAYAREFALGFPALAFFLAAWTAGEFTGALTGRSPHAAR